MLDTYIAYAIGCFHSLETVIRQKARVAHALSNRRNYPQGQAGTQRKDKATTGQYRIGFSDDAARKDVLCRNGRWMRGCVVQKSGQ